MIIFVKSYLRKEHSLRSSSNQKLEIFLSLEIKVIKTNDSPSIRQPDGFAHLHVYMLKTKTSHS